MKQDIETVLLSKEIEFNNGKYMDYKKAVDTLLNNGIKTIGAYNKLQSLYPKILPPNPEEHYSKEWINWDFFLSKRKYVTVTFQEARELIANLNLKKQADYQAIYAQYEGKLPKYPQSTYKEWVGWGYFLGIVKTKDNKPIVYETYQKAKELLAPLGLKNSSDYEKVYEKLNLPYSPVSYYKDEWEGWSYFFGKKEFTIVPFEEAMEILRENNITSQGQYYKFYKKTKGKLPSNPSTHPLYIDKWESWPKFFGWKEYDYVSYKEACDIIKPLKLTKQSEYRKIYKDYGGKLPSNPAGVGIYEKEWESWAYFLGNYPSYVDLKAIINKKGITDMLVYHEASLKNPMLPINPHKVYAKSWTSWEDFFKIKEKNSKKVLTV